MSKAFFLLVAICFAYTAAACAQTLGVVNRSEGSFVFLDLKSEHIISVPNVGTFPHEVAVDEHGSFAYVPDYGGSKVAVINLRKQKLEKHLNLPGFNKLHGIAISNNVVWVTAEEQRALVPLNGDFNPKPTLGYRSHMVTAVTGRKELYVANIESGTVSILHPDGSSPVVLMTGKGSEGIDASPDGRAVWASNRAENTISIIETVHRVVSSTIPSHGDFPVKLVFRPDGKEVWVSNNRSGNVAIFESANKTLRHVLETGGRPLGIVFSNNSRYGYISRPGAEEILEIDIEDNYRIVRRLKIPGSPDGMIWIGEQK